MAIDTAEKRRSISGIPFIPLWPGVTPNASKDGEWRQQVGWGYSGITTSEPAPVPAIEIDLRCSYGKIVDLECNYLGEIEMWAWRTR